MTITGSLGGDAFTTQSFTLTVQNVAARSAGSEVAATPDGTGYWVVIASGAVTAYGTAANFGSAARQQLNAPMVGMASTPDGKGYWLVASDGGVFSFGDAPFLGSMGGNHLNQPVVGMAKMCIRDRCATIFYLRAPGMTMFRIPIFSWNCLLYTSRCV